MDHAEAKALIKEFKYLAKGETLPVTGACGTFYAHITSPEESVVIGTGKEYVVFHFNHGDIIENISADGCGWHVDAMGGRISITLILRHEENPYMITLSLNEGLDENRKFISFLKSKKRITIHFLAIMHGNIVKHDSREFRIPKDIALQLQMT